ncbi:DivIVA protein [Amycolatopsis tolypomycina]|uniref:DivIVA protein n=1 Tax=Amycolatopsis tolypomycina TaxID=208445 RepID=A0A1H5A129_9PSEU|nr:DivIVA domain-containing protein [Amycolatopsis tolypomycina]SED36156.1 DivIVA protein [Amycolatopsis tolypomycina]
MAPGGGEDEVRTRPEFDLAWRGFQRAQVTEYVAWAEAEMRRLTAEREAARQRVATLAEENGELRAKIDRISRTPIAPDALQERSRRMIELTREEAAEITARATEAAERTRREAEQEAVRLTEKERALVAEAEAERERRRAEHEEFVRAAEQRRRELDEAAAHRRAQLEEDHTRAMTVRRAASMRELAEQEAAARAKADHLVTTAEHHLATAKAKAEEVTAAAERQRQDFITDGERQLAAAKAEAEELAAEAKRRREDQLAAAKAEAEQLVAEAERRSESLVKAAEGEVAALSEVRDRLQATLLGCRGLLSEAAVALDDRPAPFDPEATLPMSKRVPVQRRSPAGDLSDAVG